ncbi:MAG TPA: M24 family metallopeptidase [Methylomirabilota bacterium]|nr:M24 family metallopeptidase [Methylomirabilota bacterium]
MTTKLQSIKKGSQIIDQIFWELFDILRTRKNLTELTLARFIRRRAKQLGAEGQAFPPIVAFGKNSSEIHHFAGSTKIGKNNFLMFDYGVKVNGYCSDFTRTIFLGKPTKFHEKIYNIVLKAQKAAIKKVKSNAISGKVDFTARTIITRSGYATRFNHGTGHGVGKKIHELPNFKPNTQDRIEKNTVVTVEPGIYLPGKFGVRIEDMILVGPNKIYSKIPKDFQSMIIS